MIIMAFVLVVLSSNAGTGEMRIDRIAEASDLQLCQMLKPQDDPRSIFLCVPAEEYNAKRYATPINPQAVPK